MGFFGTYAGAKFFGKDRDRLYDDHFEFVFFWEAEMTEKSEA